MFYHQQRQISKKTNKALQKEQQKTHITAPPVNGTHPAALIQRAKLNPNSLNTDDVLRLQQTIGNRAATQLIAGRSGQRVQAKLTIGEPDNEFERQADRVAAQVAKQIHAPVSQQAGQGQAVQRESSSGEEKELQMKPMLQLRSAKDGMSAAPEVEASIQQARGGGQPLADSIREPMEQAFGADFSRVKVHTDSRADQLNQSIQAKAFTTGEDVFFGQGEYNPGSRGGQELLAHELTHVVQQNGGRKMRLTQQSGTGQLVQRYTTERSADKKLYNVSQNRRFVVGIKYPNHDLFVSNESDVERMNEIAREGMIEFEDKGSVEKMFGDVEPKTYHKVYPKYKETVQTSVPLQGHMRELKENREAQEKKIKGVQLDKGAVRPQLITMSNHGESIRKLIVQVLFNKRRYEAAIQKKLDNIRQGFIGFNKELRAYLDGEGDIQKVQDRLNNFQLEVWSVIREHTGGEKKRNHSQRRELDELFSEVIRYTSDLVVMVSTTSNTFKNSLLKAHEADQIETLQRGGEDNLLLPGGCDLMVGTILGKLVSGNERDRGEAALVYQHGGESNKHHFTTRLCSDGKDYVTLEGFAASGLQVHDNRWEFYLHGNRESPEASFLDYTKTRYELMGETDDSKPTVFEQRQRDPYVRTVSQMRQLLNQYQAESDQEKNQGWLGRLNKQFGRKL